MKKVLLNRLQLGTNKLTNKEKKEITGGFNDLGNDSEVILCFCPHLGWTHERCMTRTQCNSYNTPNGRVCFQGMSSDCSGGLLLP